MVKGSAKKLKLTPSGDRVLVEIPLREEKTKSGIIIPETVNQEKPEQGKVVAVGGGRVNEDGKIIPVRVKVGDTVIFSKYGYDEVKLDGKEYYIVREENILGVISN